VLPERSTPERLYLETLFASLLSYGTTTKLLTELLPLDEQLNVMTIRNHLLAVAKRSEAELGTEQVSFIEGCRRDGAKMPIPMVRSRLASTAVLCARNEEKDGSRSSPARVYWRFDAVTPVRANQASASALCRPMMIDPSVACSSF
jgi:hypothetical protein